MNKENKKNITKEDIKKIYFGNMDFSRFSDIDTEDAIENILSIIRIWEKNKT
ncbi:MAG: hypothetical protein ACOCUI_00625 [bacterium]